MPDLSNWPTARLLSTAARLPLIAHSTDSGLGSLGADPVPCYVMSGEGAAAWGYGLSALVRNRAWSLTSFCRKLPLYTSKWPHGYSRRIPSGAARAMAAAVRGLVTVSSDAMQTSRGNGHSFRRSRAVGGRVEEHPWRELIAPGWPGRSRLREEPLVFPVNYCSRPARGREDRQVIRLLSAQAAQLIPDGGAQQPGGGPQDHAQR